jgi:hypothetical protein
MEMPGDPSPGISLRSPPGMQAQLQTVCLTNRLFW